MARAMLLKLSGAGYAVQVASDGAEALKILADDKFDLILLDLMLPKIDGFAVLQTLRQRQINTHIIILTNLSQREDIDKAAALGVHDFFIKTQTSLSDLINQINTIVNSDHEI